MMIAARIGLYLTLRPTPDARTCKLLLLSTVHVGCLIIMSVGEVIQVIKAELNDN